ncbi:MAG: TerB family tellurite resistance protein [Deltaproteobacteria bacterium]|nr:TerB family tellurite resistance protein [Deltaproteobacteria bacterium]
MGWLGKVVGGTIGFALGGPLGAVAGATFGHAFDKNEQEYLSSPGGRMPLSEGEEEQLTFFVATFSMLAKLAKSDGRISDEEIKSIEQFMVHDLNLDHESRRVAGEIFQAATQSPEPFGNFASQFYNLFSYKLQILEMMIDILIRVSVADGRMSKSEEGLIQEAVRIFNFNENAYQKLKSKYVDDSDKYYSVLGTDPNASDDQIKQQYRKLVREYHPDTIASKGLPEEFTKFANDKFREIQEAYETVKKERGL